MVSLLFHHDFLAYGLPFVGINYPESFGPGRLVACQGALWCAHCPTSPAIRFLRHIFPQDKIEITWQNSGGAVANLVAVPTSWGFHLLQVLREVTKAFLPLLATRRPNFVGSAPVPSLIA